MCAEQWGPSVEGTDEWRCTTMQTRRFIRWAVAAVLAAAAIVLAACSGSETDKAGGADEVEPRVLTMAVQSGVPDQMSAFAEEVSRLSEGALEITFSDKWRMGEPTYETGTLEDVKAGKVDMAWVGARAFDTVGVTSFQALLAPQLIDSYDLQAKVFEEGIPDEMLQAVDELDLVGIGVLPGPMRKVLGVSQPFVAPADFAGQVVGIQDSAVAEQTFDALGATPKPVPAEAPLDGLDAYEQQLASIEGNSYDANAKYVTSNVNLWPRPLVIVMGNDAYDSLTDAQQAALRDAAESAIPKALEASRTEDEEAVGMLCRRGLTFTTASESDLAELRSAFEPVYADLGSDAETKSYLDAIISLKTEIAASAEAPGCPASGSGESSSAGIPEGTYETTITRDDYADWGVEVENTGVFTLEFTDGIVILRDPSGEVGFQAPYTLFRDKFEAVGDPDTLTARWAFDGTKLEFEDFGACSTGSPCVPLDEFNYHVVWASHPWVRAEPEPGSIDGVYRASFTREELASSPLLYESGEINDENWGELTLTFDQGRVTFEQENDVMSSSTSGTYTLDDDAVVLDFTEGVNAGETFDVRWSLFRDQLTFTRDEALGIIPTPYLIEPWERSE
jgi:TRAP-type C4-dicarboxylate transport system substrate-binding protein